jgi:hypothetical protein
MLINQNRRCKTDCANAGRNLPNLLFRMLAEAGVASPGNFELAMRSGKDVRRSRIVISAAFSPLLQSDAGWHAALTRVLRQAEQYYGVHVCAYPYRPNQAAS